MGLWDIDKIPYVGREKGPQEGLAFHYYDADKVVAGKKMKDWLRFGVAWWHTFDQELVDPFGTGTAQRPWYGKYSDPEDEALAKVDYAFEFFQKLGVRRHLRVRRRPAEALPGDRQAPGCRELRVLGWT